MSALRFIWHFERIALRLQAEGSDYHRGLLPDILPSARPADTRGAHISNLLQKMPKSQWLCPVLAFHNPPADWLCNRPLGLESAACICSQ